MKKIYLIRHAQSHANAGGHAMPNADIPITALGQQQAEQLAQWLIDHVGTDISSIGISTYQRTHQTAAPFLKYTHLEPTIIEGLQEFNYLSFNAIEHKSFEERLDLADAYWLNFQPDMVDGIDAENFNQFVERVRQVQDYFKQLPDGTHIIFSHGLWISMLIWLILGQPTHNNQSMQKYRQFELAVRAKNCEVFLLTFADNYTDNHTQSITKVRHLEST